MRKITKHLRSAPSIVLFLLALPFFIFSQTKIIPYQQLPTSTGAPSGSGMYFGATMTTGSITVTFEGPSNRWIALGLGSFMNPTDVLIYSNGKSGATHPLGWNDYYNSSTAASGVNLDPVQNWNVISNTAASGQRTVVASRALSTGDLSNDVIINFTASALSIVWARSASADYTIAYHGSTNRAYGMSLPWLTPPTASFSTITTTLCAGSSVLFTNATTGGQTSYVWSFPSGSPASSTATNPTVTYTTPGTYSVTLVATNAVGTDTYTQLSYITVTPTVSPATSISLISGTNPNCAGSLLTFSANSSNGGSAPSYQWKINGINTGSNSPIYSSSSISNSAIVTCILTSNVVCANPTTVSSVPLTMTVNSTAPATVSVSLTAGTNPMCTGASATFSAIGGNTGSSPSYQWQLNGLNAGANSPTFSSTSFVNGNLVTCILTSNAPCASATMVTSAAVTITVSNILVPSIAIALTSGSSTICSGTPVTFSASGQNGGSSPSYQWQVNGLNVGNNSPVFTSSILATGAQVSCMMTSNSACASPSVAASGSLVMTVNPVPPAPAVAPSGTLSICSNSNLILSSSATFGNLWSSGANTQTISVSTPGIYSVSQTLNGCTSGPSAGVTISVNPLPIVSLTAIKPLCKDDGAVILQGSPVGGSYAGTGVSSNTFNPAGTGSGTFLIVYNYVDANLCSDTAAVILSVTDCSGLLAPQKEELHLTIFPNPGSGKFTINFENEEIHGIRVWDINGKEVFDRKEFNERLITLDLSNFGPGYYLLEVESATFTARAHLLKIE